MELTPDHSFALAILLMQGVWALLMLLAGVMLRRIATDLETNSTAIQALARSMAQNQLEALREFVPKGEWEVLRERYHDMNNEVIALKSRDSFARELVSAFAERGHHEASHHPAG